MESLLTLLRDFEKERGEAKAKGDNYESKELQLACHLLEKLPPSINAKDLAESSDWGLGLAELQDASNAATSRVWRGSRLWVLEMGPAAPSRSRCQNSFLVPPTT